MKLNKAIEGARGYLILCIVLYHYTSRYPFYGNESFIWDTGFLLGKNLGVAGFFIISGFLYFNSVKKWNINSHEVFFSVLKKIKRLYLPFAVAVIFLGGGCPKTLYPYKSAVGIMRSSYVCFNTIFYVVSQLFRILYNK